MNDLNQNINVKTVEDASHKIMELLSEQNLNGLEMISILGNVMIHIGGYVGSLGDDDATRLRYIGDYSVTINKLLDNALTSMLNAANEIAKQRTK